MTPEERAADINRRYPGYLNPFLEAQIAAAIRAAEQEAAAREREACAKVGDFYAGIRINDAVSLGFTTAAAIAAAIRARK